MAKTLCVLNENPAPFARRHATRDDLTAAGRVSGLREHLVLVQCSA
jgi:hypothetical protein